MNTLIFDLDGTLLNTLVDIGEACNTTMRAHGYPVHKLEDYNMMVGNGFAKLVERVLPEDIKNTIDANGLAALVEEAKASYAARMTQQTIPYAGMPKILATLVERGVNLAVLSNKPDPLTIALAEHYFPDIKFLFVHGAVADMPLKPHPGFLLHLAKQHRIDLEKAYYVGDSLVDITLGQNARMATAGACWGFRGADELRDATILLERPKDLLSITESWK